MRVGITAGDYNGVGYEVMVKAIADEGVTELYTPVLFADRKILLRALKQFGVVLPHINFITDLDAIEDDRINVVDLNLGDAEVLAGKPDSRSGAAAVAALDLAVEALRDEQIDVLVTAPISKEAVQGEGFNFAGHTEYLEDRAGDGSKALMILMDDTLRVALVTTHLPVGELSAAITRERVADSIRRLSASVRQDFGILRPKIAVLALNPHCGDGGLLGTEEQEVIAPAIEEVIGEGILAFGPFAADGFFGSGAYAKYDGVLAMYHDQGLAPFKALAGEHGVNYTAGLPWIRTSPDHGTACDIAWTGVADPTSMREAIYKAIDIYRTRQRHLEAAANPLETYVAPKRERDNRRGPIPERGERGGERVDRGERGDRGERTDRGDREEQEQKGEEAE